MEKPSERKAWVTFGLLSSSHPDPAPNFCRWTITDLASSNGTILNDIQLEPSVPSVLSDGDVIKIGEVTSIKVLFEVTGCGSECNSGNARRNHRRGAVGRGKRVVELGVIGENTLGYRNNLRGKTEKIVVLENEGGEMGNNEEGKVRGRRTRGSNKVSENSCEETEGKMDNVGKVSLRMTRISQKEENSGALENGKEEIVGKVEYVGEVKGKGGRNVSVRRARGSKEEEKSGGSEDLDEIRDEDCVHRLMKAGQRARVRRTRLDLIWVSMKVERQGKVQERKRMYLWNPLKRINWWKN
ncbi:FHA domain-containing protein-like [Forsythia ovata]|uniref:FHA domain-containing protein-like n=1 Tax=Forsythia ovata TaxID=205694 RepID=A0ABD1TSY6_9LAMI